MGYETYPSKKSGAKSGKLFKRKSSTYGTKGCDGDKAKGNYGTAGVSGGGSGGGAGGGGRSRGARY